jgi:hypothetical protein
LKSRYKDIEKIKTLKENYKIKKSLLEKLNIKLNSRIKKK